MRARALHDLKLGDRVVAEKRIDALGNGDGFVTQRKSGAVICPYREGGAFGLAVRLVAAFRPYHALRRAPRGNVLADNGGPLCYQFALGKPVLLEGRPRNPAEMMIKAFHILHFDLACMNLS